MSSPDLLHRIACAPEGSRELDALVEISTFRGRSFNYGPLIYSDGEIEYGTVGDHGEVRWSRRYKVPHYTTSLDAALTLVPEGWGWIIGDDCSAQLLEPDWRENPCDRGIGDEKGKAATPALALCIAAIRAREAL